MNQEITGKQVINGTYGETWVGDYYMDSVTATKGVVTREFATVKKPRQLEDEYKEISRKGEGEVTYSHVDSYDLMMLARTMSEDKQESATIISKLSDPNSEGEERIAYYGCVFPELILADWKAATAGEKTLKFNFVKHEILGQIER